MVVWQKTGTPIHLLIATVKKKCTVGVLWLHLMPLTNPIHLHSGSSKKSEQHHTGLSGKKKDGQLLFLVCIQPSASFFDFLWLLLSEERDKNSRINKEEESC